MFSVTLSDEGSEENHLWHREVVTTKSSTFYCGVTPTPVGQE